MKNFPSTWINPNWIPKRFPLAKIPYTPNFETIGEAYTNWQATRPKVSPQQVKSILIDNLFNNAGDKIDDLGKSLNATKVKPLNPVLKGASALGALYGIGAGIANYDREKEYLKNQELTEEDRKFLAKQAMRTGRAYIGNTIVGGIAGGLLGGPSGILPGAALGSLITSGADSLSKFIMDKKGIPYRIIDGDGVPEGYNQEAKKETAKETVKEPPSILPESRRALGIPEPTSSAKGPSSSVEEYILDNANPNVVYAPDGTPIPLNEATLDYNNKTNGQPVDNTSTTTQTNPALLSPSPSSNNTSTEMLATLMLLAGGGTRPSFSLGGNVMGGAAPFSYNDYLTPIERNMLNSIQSNQLSNPDELRRLVNDYYNAQDLQNRTTAYRQQLGYKGDVPRDTTELERLLGENKFAQELLAAQNTLYDNVMKRADAMRMAQQYGIPYSVAANSMNSVMQYLINPYITAQLKRENMPYETLQKMIETVTTGEQNRQTETTKGEQNRETIDRLWGMYRTPIEMATLDSLEKRTADTNKTRRQLGYNQALIAEANMKNQRYLQQIGLPLDMAKAVASSLAYTIPNSQQYNQIMNMLNMLTGMDMMSLGSNLIPTGTSSSGMVDDTYDWIE